MSAPRNHFLDALRGIAALLVLAHHLHQALTGFYPSGWLAGHPQVGAVLDHGAIGVDVFFLISGFIVFLAARRVIHAGRGVRLFLLKRFLRIFLPYWPIALALGFAYTLLQGLSAATDPIAVNWFKSLSLIPGGGAYSLSVAWTLSFELFFYLLLGLSLSLRKPTWRWGLIAAPSLLALLFAATSGSLGFGKASNPIGLLLSPYNWEFLLGCVLGALATQPRPWVGELRSHVPLQVGLLLLASVLLLVPFPTTLAFRFALLLVLATLILLSSVRDFERLCGVRSFAWVGSISYSLYLLHNPIQSLVVRLSTGLALPEFSAAFLLIVLPILAAWAYFISVESWSLWLIRIISVRPTDGASSSQSV